MLSLPAAVLPPRLEREAEVRSVSFTVNGLEYALEL
jgi:hypothetical protein